MSLTKRLKTFEFLYILFYLSVNQMWLNAHIGTLEQQLKMVYSEEKGTFQ